MSTNRMSFGEMDGKNGRPHWRDCIGFINHVVLSYREATNELVIHKGSLVYGFKDGDMPAYGYLIDDDAVCSIPADQRLYSSYYLTMRKDGYIELKEGSMNQVSGIGANINDIPWYTFGGDALIGKVFQYFQFATHVITCDDAFWCEYENPFGENV